MGEVAGGGDFLGWFIDLKVFIHFLLFRCVLSGHEVECFVLSTLVPKNHSPPQYLQVPGVVVLSLTVEWGVSMERQGPSYGVVVHTCV